MVKVKFEKGAVGYVYDHFQSQGSYVASGRLKITIIGKSEIVGAGDGFFVPPNPRHGAECLQGGVLIDTFSSVREDL